MEKLGFEAEELAGLMQDDAQGTLIEVLRGLQDVDADERGAVVSQLFGEEVKGAVSKLVTNLDDGENGLIKAFSRVAKAADRAGSVDVEFAGIEKTRAHQLSKLGSKFDDMTITLGESLMPVLDAVVPPLITVIDTFTKLIGANKSVAGALLSAASGVSRTPF
jgi:TP901 family phage tail tape measure protein